MAHNQDGPSNHLTFSQRYGYESLPEPETPITTSANGPGSPSGGGSTGSPVQGSPGHPRLLSRPPHPAEGISLEAEEAEVPEHGSTGQVTAHSIDQDIEPPPDPEDPLPGLPKLGRAGDIGDQGEGLTPL